jgi:hypothetical protein
MALPLLRSASSATTGHAIGFVVLCVKGLMCSSLGCILNGTSSMYVLSLTLWSRVLEKQMLIQLVKEFNSL